MKINSKSIKYWMIKLKKKAQQKPNLNDEIRRKKKS